MSYVLFGLVRGTVKQEVCLIAFSNGRYYSTKTHQVGVASTACLYLLKVWATMHDSISALSNCLACIPQTKTPDPQQFQFESPGWHTIGPISSWGSRSPIFLALVWQRRNLCSSSEVFVFLIFLILQCSRITSFYHRMILQQILKGKKKKTKEQF